jgi:DOPA 4,5-dioxygenase
MSDPSSIAEYHAHVYYDPQATRDRAERLRARVAAEFPLATLGRWHDELVGPHTQIDVSDRISGERTRFFSAVAHA